MSYRTPLRSSTSSSSGLVQCNKSCFDLKCSDIKSPAKISVGRFHPVCGHDVSVTSDGRSVKVTSTSGRLCYAFTANPLSAGDVFAVKVLTVYNNSEEGFAFGMTSCDPDSITKEDLPSDPDLLMDRPEYWVVVKGVLRSACEVQDVLSFHRTDEGEIRLHRNGRYVTSLMHVDKTLPMWAFVDIYGRIRALQNVDETLPVEHPVATSPLNNLVSVRAAIRETTASEPCRTTVRSHADQSAARTTSSVTSPTSQPTTSLAGVSQTSAAILQRPAGETTPSGRLEASRRSSVLARYPWPPPPEQQTAESIETNDFPSATRKSSSSVGVPRQLSTPNRSQSASSYPRKSDSCTTPQPSTKSAAANSGTTQTQVSSPQPELEIPESSECCACLDKPKNSVLYRCGHVCLCYECAVDLRKTRRPALCPICRQTIDDVIRIYNT